MCTCVYLFIIKHLSNTFFFISFFCYIIHLLLISFFNIILSLIYLLFLFLSRYKIVIEYLKIKFIQFINFTILSQKKKRVINRRMGPRSMRIGVSTWEMESPVTRTSSSRQWESHDCSIHTHNVARSITTDISTSLAPLPHFFPLSLCAPTLYK